jgi:hypothetical protein
VIITDDNAVDHENPECVLISAGGSVIGASGVQELKNTRPPAELLTEQNKPLNNSAQPPKDPIITTPGNGPIVANSQTVAPSTVQERKVEIVGQYIVDPKTGKLIPMNQKT